MFMIYSGVKASCTAAVRQYQTNCVDSLIKLIQSENYSFREKNRAIWALGQLADNKALPFLYQLDKALPDQIKCNHDQYLCRYEVKKAIKWCNQGNITSWMYSNRSNWR